jgi:SulP family sulfate permease
MVLAAFLFMQHMIRSSKVSQLSKDTEESHEINRFAGIPPGVEVFEITGPLFFGAAYKFRDAMKFIERPPKILIIRMRQVPIIDATGIKTIREIHRDAVRHHPKLLLSEISSEQVMEELKTAMLLFAIGKANVTSSFSKAVERCYTILRE